MSEQYLPSVELSPAAARAVEAALGAGACAAEAYASRDTGREVRVHGGEVESLTAATQTGIGIRAWSGHRVGYAYGTDLTEAGVAALAARAAEMAAVADEDEFAAPPEPHEIEALPGLDSPSVGEWTPGQVAELALTVERTALAADPRVAGVETAVYADSTEQVAIASSTGIAAAYESANCFAYLQALAEGDGGRETGLGFGLARGPEDLDPEAIGAEGAERAVAMIGAGKPASRSCPVVLDPTVAASFAGLIGGALGARAVQRGRSPFAGRLGEEVASTTFALHDDGRDPAGAASAPFDGEGVPRRRTALIEGGALQGYLYDTYTANREGTRLDRLGRAGGLPLAALGLGLEPDRRHRRRSRRSSCSPRRATASSSPTSPASTRASTRSPASSPSAPPGGRSATARWPSRSASSRSPASWSRCCARSSAAGSEARWVPFGGSVSTPPLLVSELSMKRITL